MTLGADETESAAIIWIAWIVRIACGGWGGWAGVVGSGSFG